MTTAACGPAEPAARFAATMGPIGAIIEQVAGEDVAVLVPAGGSPHTYDPRPSDARSASRAEILFFGSETLDGWSADLEARRRQALMELLPDSLQLAGRRGMGFDPHFWLDPLAVKALLPGVAAVLCGVDEARCEVFEANADVFSTRLDAVHDSLTVLMAPVAGARVLAAHPFLTYFAARYDLKVVGVVEEIAGSEPSPRDIRRLIDVARSNSARAVFVQPQHAVRPAAAIAEAVGIPVVEIDPLAGARDVSALLMVTARRIREGLLTTREGV